MSPKAFIIKHFLGGIRVRVELSLRNVGELNRIAGNSATWTESDKSLTASNYLKTRDLRFVTPFTGPLGTGSAKSHSMTYKQAIKTLAVVAGLATCAVQTKAVEITVLDYTGPQTPELLNNITGVWGPLNGWNGGPRGQGLEDNEVEAYSVRTSPTTVHNTTTSKSQRWDVEGLSIRESTKHLYLVGGYDFNLGIAGGRPGDLFIKLGSQATFQPVANTGTYLNGNGLGGTPGYDYAIRLSAGIAGGPLNVTVWDLNANTILVSDTNDQLGSNPWKVQATGNTFDATFTTTSTYTQGLTAGGVAALTGEPGYAGLLGDTDGPNSGGQSSSELPFLTNKHNVVDLDISFLAAVLPKNRVLTFSYTMECGNDSVKGLYTGGFKLVPDGGTSLMLLGGGLSALCFVGRRFRK
jgi:hypothetical protein